MSLGRKPILTLTLLAIATIAQRTFVDGTGATATAGANAMGASISDASTGDSFSVDTDGVVEVISGGAIAANALVEVGASGYAVTKDEGIGVARSMEAIPGAGYVMLVKMIPN